MREEGRKERGRSVRRKREEQPDNHYTVKEDDFTRNAEMESEFLSKSSQLVKFFIAKYLQERKKEEEQKRLR
jgi:hypothetical protein